MRNHWKRDFSSLRAYDASVEPNRKRLAHILGLRDPAVQFDTAEQSDDFSPTTVFQARREPTACRKHSLAGLWRRDRRRARSDPNEPRLPMDHSHRHPRRRPDARTAFRPGAGRAGRVSGGSPAGRERLQRDRAGLDRPDRRGSQRPGRADQPRVCLSLGLRAGPAHHRLRGPEGARPGRSRSRRSQSGTQTPRSASSAMAKEARSRSTRRRSIRGSMPSA